MKDSKRFRILIIFGTRPELIKLAPLIKVFQKEYSGRVEVLTVNVAQHREMVDQLLKVFGITPCFDLNIMRPKQSLHYITVEALKKLSELYDETSPDYVVIQGDTTTAMAASLSAFYKKIPVGHVEAGLRTHNRYSPFPEEINRRLIAVLAYHHFAPTKSAYENLLKEGIEKRSVFLTGNTVIDAVLDIVNSGKLSPPGYVLPHKKVILVTAHRRENWGKKLESICNAIKRLALNFEEVQFIYPVHLNPIVREIAFRILQGIPRVKLVDPVDYLELLSLMKCSYLILTDSGGIQEEAPALGKPVLVLRNTTERPEGINEGVAMLVGTDEDKIFNVTAELIRNESFYKSMAKKKLIYGDGKAANRIANIIFEFLQKGSQNNEKNKSIDLKSSTEQLCE